MGTVSRESAEKAFVPEPIGHTQVPAPQSPWSIAVNGQTITPELVQKTLLRCRQAGLDMWYIADRLQVGNGAIDVFISRKRTIPPTIAKRFYEVFSSGESLPKAPAPIVPLSKPDDWEVFLPKERKTPVRRKQTPDYDAAALAKAVFEARRTAQLTQTRLACRAKCSYTYIYNIERGRLSNSPKQYASLVRICEILGVNLCDFELKPRVDFPLFQAIVRAEVKIRKITWAALMETSGVPHNWVNRYLSEAKPRATYVYLDEYVMRIMDALKLDLNEVLLTKKGEKLTVDNV